MVSNPAQPLVSIGLPAYNRPLLLCRALESLTQQSYKNLEIIISDDCSPGEGTQKVVQAFIQKDSRIRHYRQKSNLGPWPNHMFVLEKATGEYFFWASEDDLWDPKFVEACIKKLEVNNRYGLVFTRFYTVSQDDEIKIKLNHNRYLKNPKRKMVFLLLDEILTHKANMIHGIWRKEILKKVIMKALSSGLTEEYVGKGYDQAFLLLTLDTTEIFQIQDVLFTKRYLDRPLPGTRRQLLQTGRENLYRMVRNPAAYVRQVHNETKQYMGLIDRVYGDQNSLFRPLIFWLKKISYITLRHVF